MFDKEADLNRFCDLACVFLYERGNADEMGGSIETSGSRIPAQYKRSEWRGTLPLDPSTGDMGVSFNLGNGETIRLKLNSENGRKLSKSIFAYLQEHNAHQTAAS
ncbi:MAG: hypothetical protein MI863_03145 [Desulfobacterales bacterium]|nr:hypothetical protein [Desulfobacterales bacterium]